MATTRELVNRLVSGIRASKLEMVGAHSEFHATLRAFQTVARRADDQHVPTLYVDLGASTTKVMMTHGPEMVFARLIGLGGTALDEAVARHANLKGEEARQSRLGMEALFAGRKTGEAAAGMTAPDLSEPLEMLTDELSMCLRYHESIFPGRKVERAVFTGGEARHTALCQHVARSLRLPAQVADPMARVVRSGKEPAQGVDFRSPQPGWSVALGLCLSPTDL